MAIKPNGDQRGPATAAAVAGIPDGINGDDRAIPEAARQLERTPALLLPDRPTAPRGPDGSRRRFRRGRTGIRAGDQGVQAG